MVHVPTRGDAPVRFGPDVPMVPEIGPGIVDAAVYTDPERYERERAAVMTALRSTRRAVPRTR